MAVCKQRESEIEKIVEQAVNENGREIYLYCGEIYETGYLRLSEKVVGDTHSRSADVNLIVTSESGISPLKNSGLFQNHYYGFHVFIPARCKSAGALVALGAHKILMTSMSELGPISSEMFQQNGIGRMLYALDGPAVVKSFHGAVTHQSHKAASDPVAAGRQANDDRPPAKSAEADRPKAA